MNITSINGINSVDKKYGFSNKQNPSFKRMPNASEMEVYTKSINAGLKLLNKQVDIIIHNSSAPSSWLENTGIGSLFSRNTQKKLIPFLKAHAITGIQQEPDGLRKLGDNSPYAPESVAKNILMIPLEKLASDEYNKILPIYDFAKIVTKSSYDGYVDYPRVYKAYDKALKIAYKNFKKGEFLKTEFEEYKAGKDEMERAAIYHILDRKYQTSWKEWEGIDKNLYAPNNEKEAEIAKARIAELKEQHKDDIDFFMFQQFILDRENQKSNELAKKTGVKIIGDSPVASPAADEWTYQNMFLKGKALGCPPDAFSADGQRWGFGYFNPKYIFNPDGSLGVAGQILKHKYDGFFASTPGGLRIDHVIGLVDPFLYSVKSKHMTTKNSGRIYSQAGGEFEKKGDEFANIMDKIVLQSAKEHGMSKKDIICEDLGEKNMPTVKVMNDFDLSGIAVTQFNYRGAETPQRNLIMLGSHDNDSYIEYTDKLFHMPERQNDFLTRTEYLAEDTSPKGISEEAKQKYKDELRTDKKKFLAASFAELFSSPARRIQIFFSDFWGLGKTYNRPGTTEGNWALRIGNNFVKDYYKAVSDGKAPNLADAISRALRARGLDKDNPELMKDLEESAKILAEA